MSAVTDQARLVVEKLHALGIPSRLVRVIEGPQMVRCEIEPAQPSIRMQQYRRLSMVDDLSCALGAQPVRILAPIPGSSRVGVEWPREDRETVSLDMLPRAQFPLTVPIGLGVDGEAVMMDLATAPHVLVAGSTGSGKTSFLHAMICSLVSAFDPSELQLVLVDPKRTEFRPYRDLPHVASMVDDVESAVGTLRGLVELMERRYKLLAALDARDLATANRALEIRGMDPIARMVTVVDEMADLMLSSKKVVEPLLVRLAQKSRAVGIHLVLATQSPRVTVITGMIKANVPSRIAFAVSSQVDSRVVLDTSGAEGLIGRGDALMSLAGAAPVRFQSPLCSSDEVAGIVAHASGREAVTT